MMIFESALEYLFISTGTTGTIARKECEDFCDKLELDIRIAIDIDSSSNHDKRKRIEKCINEISADIDRISNSIKGSYPLSEIVEIVVKAFKSNLFDRIRTLEPFLTKSVTLCDEFRKDIAIAYKTSKTITTVQDYYDLIDSHINKPANVALIVKAVEDRIKKTNASQGDIVTKTVSLNLVTATKANVDIAIKTEIVPAILIGMKMYLIKKLWFKEAFASSTPATKDFNDLFAVLEADIRTTLGTRIDELNNQKKHQEVMEIMNKSTTISAIDTIVKMITTTICPSIPDVLINNYINLELEKKLVGAIVNDGIISLTDEEVKDYAEAIKDLVLASYPTRIIDQKDFLDIFEKYCDSPSPAHPELGIVTPSTIYSKQQRNNLKNRAEIYFVLLSSFTHFDNTPPVDKFFINKPPVPSPTITPGTMWEHYYNNILKPPSVPLKFGEKPKLSQEDADSIAYIIENQLTDFFPTPNTGSPVVSSVPKDSDQSTLGLLVGHVQSGKTDFMMGVIAKAYDNGYDSVILLTSCSDILKEQTFKRLSENLISPLPSITIRILSANGNFFMSETNPSATNTFDYDNNLNSMTLYVVMKEKTVLENLSDAVDHVLNSKNNYPGSTTNVLIIDDEGDNASINTNAPGEGTTTTNGAIIDILDRFDLFHYLSVTATPAAVVVNTQIPTGTNKDFTLYPSDYAIATHTSKNYIGLFKTHLLPSHMNKSKNSHILDQGKHRHQVILIEDDLYKEKDLKTAEKTPDEIEPAFELKIKEAMYSYYIVNAIRDIRNSRKGFVDAKEDHRTMLITHSALQKNHLEMYIVVYKLHEDAKARLDVKDISIIDDIQNVFYENHNIAINCGHCYDTICTNDGITWDEVLDEIIAKTKDITINVVNGQDSKDANAEIKRRKLTIPVPEKLDYTKGSVRPIVIGGNSVSRGFTLEGLCVSLYHRKTITHDVLLQHCRWFGYRKDYDDLFRVFINENANTVLEYVALSLDNFLHQLEYIKHLDLTPEKFSIDFKQFDSPSLDNGRITGENKGKYSKYFDGRMGSDSTATGGTAGKGKSTLKGKIPTNFWGTINELNSYKITPNMQDISKNLNLIDKMLVTESLTKTEFLSYEVTGLKRTTKDTRFKTGVSIADIKSYISDFCYQLNSDDELKKDLIEFLSDPDNAKLLPEWDLAFAEKARYGVSRSHIFPKSGEKIRYYLRNGHSEVTVLKNDFNITDSYRLNYRYNDPCIGISADIGPAGNIAYDPALNPALPAGVTTFTDYFDKLVDTIDPAKGHSGNHKALWVENLYYNQRKPLLLISINCVEDNAEILANSDLNALSKAKPNVLQYVPVMTIFIPNKL